VAAAAEEATHAALEAGNRVGHTRTFARASPVSSGPASVAPSGLSTGSQRFSPCGGVPGERETECVDPEPLRRLLVLDVEDHHGSRHGSCEESYLTSQGLQCKPMCTTIKLGATMNDNAIVPAGGRDDV
jgi:hypothetical protein